MKQKLKKLLCYTLMVCMVLTLFSPAQAQAAKKGDGSRKNPYSAYDAKRVKVYSGSHYRGKFKVKLLDYKDGKEAKNFIQDDYLYLNEDVKKNDECVYMKFRIAYLSGQKEVSLNSVVYIDGDVYDKKSNRHLWTNSLYGYNTDLDCLSATSMYPGGSIKCYELFTIPKGNTPITYRIQTGYNNKTNEEEYTWFTTKK